MAELAIRQSTGTTHGLFGWSSARPATPVQEPALDAMITALGTSRPVSRIENDLGACGTTGSICRLGRHGFTAVIGTPRWETGGLRDIPAGGDPAAILAAAYSQDPHSFMHRIGGAFSLVVADLDHNTVLLAIDRMGQHQLYYYPLSKGLVFGSTADIVTGHPAATRAIDPQGVYNYVYFHMVPGPGSIYRGLRKLQAAHVVQVRDGDIREAPYWLPDFDDREATPGNTLQEELKETLKAAVNRCRDGEADVGAFLSGGLDSSTVTGMLSEIQRGPAKAFSIGFAAEGYDEVPYARKTARHFGADINEYYVSPEDVASALPFIATGFDEPFGNSSALPAWFCARFAAESGIRRMLAGDGGDELFAGNERYAKQKLFTYYALVPEALKKRMLEPAINFSSVHSRLAKKAASYIEQANIPLPDRLHYYNFLHRHPPDEIFTADFLEQIDTELPLALLRNTFHRPETASNLNRMLYLDWQFTLADNDLRKVSRMCESAGVEVAYPMLDDDLVRLSCRIPTDWKLKGYNLRAFYKDTFRDWLPEETIKKKKHGFGLPFGVWMQTHRPLQEIAYDSLLTLSKKGIFNPRLIERVIDLHRTGHASYYGEFIWILTVLQLWMQGHVHE